MGAGIYATALWLIGRVSALPGLAAPGDDRGALEADVREAVQRRAARSAASAEARQGRERPAAGLVRDKPGVGREADKRDAGQGRERPAAGSARDKKGET